MTVPITSANVVTTPSVAGELMATVGPFPSVGSMTRSGRVNVPTLPAASRAVATRSNVPAAAGVSAARPCESSATGTPATVRPSSATPTSSVAVTRIRTCSPSSIGLSSSRMAARGSVVSGRTVSPKDCSALPPRPSLARTVTAWEPMSGIALGQVMRPLASRAMPAGDASSVYVTRSPSGSVATGSYRSAWPSGSVASMS